MHVSSRFAAGLAVALAVLITLGGIGVPTSQAQDPSQVQGQDQSGAYCPQPCPQACPPKPECTVVVPDCQVPRLEKPCAPPPCDTCCPVDPKEVRRAQRRSDHAAHEAAEACRRQQRAFARAQERVNRETDRQNARIDRANARFEHERAEYEAALSKSATLNAQQQAQQSAAVSCPAPTEERAKPEPTTPEPVTPSVVTPTPAPEPAPVPEAAPAPTPAPAPQTAPPISQEVTPKELPKTASPFELIGLIGLASSVTGYYLTRAGRN